MGDGGESRGRGRGKLGWIAAPERELLGPGAWAGALKVTYCTAHWDGDDDALPSVRGTDAATRYRNIKCWMKHMTTEHNLPKQTELSPLAFPLSRSMRIIIIMRLGELHRQHHHRGGWVGCDEMHRHHHPRNGRGSARASSLHRRVLTDAEQTFPPMLTSPRSLSRLFTTHDF
nr:hypothetical protein CFP56_60232 [Quercus suber]